MGLTISHMIEKWFGKKQVRVIMLGLDAAGKTTMLYKMKLGDVVESIPTIGFNVETLEYKSLRFTVWDLGGQERLRDLWKHYYEGSDAVIFVVDSSDFDRIDQAKAELKNVMGSEELRDCVLLVYANKQDVVGAMSTDEIGRQLELQSFGRKHHIQASVAPEGQGLNEGLEWLSKALENKGH